MSDTKKDANVRDEEFQFVIFGLSGEEFGVDISQVREIIRMQDITPVPKAPEFIEGVVNIRGQIIVVMDLAKRFGLKSEDRSDKARIVVAEVKGNIVGLIVDEVPEVLRISKNRIDPAPHMLETQIHSEFIKGLGKLENRIIILLDVDKILSQEEAKQVGEAVK